MIAEEKSQKSLRGVQVIKKGYVPLPEPMFLLVDKEGKARISTQDIALIVDLVVERLKGG